MPDQNLPAAESGFKPSLADQIACVRREIGMRRRVYPRWVEGGRMTQAKADAETAAMVAVLETLENLERGSRLI